MKTLEQFIEQQERGRGARPGEANFFPFDCYLGVKKDDNGRYEVLIVRDNTPNLDQLQAYSLLCDVMLKYCSIKFELNFSDNIETEEQQFIHKMCDLVKDCGYYREHYRESAEEAANLRPAAIRAANAGLSDPWK